MGKVPIRLKEVVYTVSPFEVTIMNGLFKDFPKKVHKHLSEVRLAPRLAALRHGLRLPSVHATCMLVTTLKV